MTFFRLKSNNENVREDNVLQLIWGLWRWILVSFQILYYLVELNCILGTFLFPP